MKKFIAILLTVAMVVPMALVPAFAAKEDATTLTVADEDSVFVEGENSLIVFVTGIGQSFSYLFDESYVQEGAFENGTLQDYENYAPLVAEGKHIARWNIFNTFDEALSDEGTIKTIVKVVLNLLVSGFIRKNIIAQEDVNSLVRSLFRFNILDEEGNTDPRVVTPRYPMPVSEYPGVIREDGTYYSEAEDRFFSAIPCKDIAEEKFGENYKDYLYVFNYSAFSYTSENVAEMKKFIDKILAENKVGATDVVLVPMSMGASVVTAYMSAYPEVEDNHIRRVVSIVGAWDGSAIFGDLFTQQYCDNSADLFYNGLIGDLVGEPWGYLINIVLRIFPKQVLRDLIDKALLGISTELLGSAPSLCNMAPTERYQDFRHLIKSDVVRAEADAFYEAKANLLDTMAYLEEQGVTFSFISGYGLPFGAITSDYKMFGFFRSAPLTNSDEIIGIESTAPGTSYVPAGQVFTDTEGRELSPEGSIDISTTVYKDSTWFFYKQKHELEYNNTALDLALDLATGTVKTVADCDNLAEDGVYYPQFNGARNLKPLRNYKNDLERFCNETGYELTASQQAVLAKAEAMADNSWNDPEADDAVLAEVESMLIEIGVYSQPEEDSCLDKALNNTLKNANDVTYKIFGAKGFLDWFI